MLTCGKGLQTIGCGVRDHIATISKLQADRKALTKQVKLLQQETAQSLGQSLAQRAGTQVSLVSVLGSAASDSAQVSIHVTAALALNTSSPCHTSEWLIQRSEH